MFDLVLLCLGPALADPLTGTEPGPSDPVTTSAPDPVPAPSPEPTTAAGAAVDTSTTRPFDEVLAEAKQRYFSGETEAPRELLEGLQLRLYSGEKPEWNLVVDALTYLGELYYVLGQQDQAQIAFRYLLEQDPKTPISPYHHSIEVVNLFELVRTTVVAARVEVPPPDGLVPDRKPVPIWTFLPFGAPQVLQGRPIAGVTYAVLQVGLGAASVGLYIQTAQLNPDTNAEGNNHPLWVGDEVTAGVERRRYTLQWPSTFAFYGTWAVSVLDAAVWHGRHPEMVPADSAPGGRDKRRSEGGALGDPVGASHPAMLYVHGTF